MKKLQDYKIELLILGAFSIFVFTIVGYFYSLYNKEPLPLYEQAPGHFESNKSENEDSLTNIDSEPLAVANSTVKTESDMKHDAIYNIALFGLDRRNETENSRTDAMMIATIDFTHDKVKLISLMRDQAVNIDGYGEDKLNHAYAYGKESLAIQTINENFGLNIGDYVTVDFQMFAKVIDILGGVEIEVKEYELANLNKNLLEIHPEERAVTSFGRIHMNGAQAVAYSRIRSVGDGDIERTERQRTLLMSVMNVIKNDTSIMNIPKLWWQVAPHIETSLGITDVIDIGREFLINKDEMKMEQIRFPTQWEPGKLDNGNWIMRIDVSNEREKIQNYLFYDIKPSVD